MNNKTIDITRFMHTGFLKIFAGALFACLLLIASFPTGTHAEEATTVDIGVTDYEALTMEIIRNGNTIIYSSLDNKKTWNQVEGTVSGDKLIMDISFANSASDVSIWFKGDKDSKVIKVVIPKQSATLKAKYDKTTGRIELSGYDDATHFRWHKSSDYNYKTVAIDISDPTNIAFCKELESIAIKGGKIVIGIPGKNGTGVNGMGKRPCKEITVSVTKKSSAPNIKLNTTKLTFNTRETMEYKVIGSGSGWKSCSKNMPLSEIAPEALAENGAKTVSIKFRNAATSTKSASLESFVTVKGQRSGPSIGTSGSDVTVSEEAGKNNKPGKTVLTFTTASKEKPIEYKIIKPGDKVDYTKGWKMAKQAGKTVKFSAKQLPKGSTILVRFKGINANAAKGIDAELPSAFTVYTVG